MDKDTLEKKETMSSRISRIFLEAISAGLSREQIENPGITADEWKAVLDLSAEQALLPLVFEAVYPFLPEDMEREYRSNVVCWVTDQVRRTDRFLKIYRELMKEGIEPLVVKGVICRETYLLPDWRVSSDEDIYVPREEYMRFHEVMNRLGFESSPLNFRSEHETVYHYGNMIIEGHWDLFPHENRWMEQMNTLTTDILKRAGYVEIEGTRIFTPDPTDHMIYLLLHAMKHFTLAGVGIRQICDVAQWDKSHRVDWERVRETIDVVGGTRFAGALIDAACRYFAMKMPEGWDRLDSTDLIEDALEGGTFGHNSEDRIHSASITSAGEQGIKDFTGIVRSVFPSRKVMEINYPWVSKNVLLLPAGWCVRLFRYAKSMGKGASPLQSIQIGRKRMKLLEEYGLARTEELKTFDSKEEQAAGWNENKQ